MPYVPGDNWCICDLSGIQVLQSQTVKTWDGLRVKKEYWYPRHPQLDVRGIPDHMEVVDGRPEQPATYTDSVYGTGDIVLASPSGLLFQVVVSNAGTVSTVSAVWQFGVPTVTLDSYTLTVTDGGVLTPVASSLTGPTYWQVVSPNGLVWNLTITGGVVTAALAG
jgi:hypothetical protein